MALRTLAGLLDVKVGELLVPLRDSHLAPLLARKLRALALPTQVAVTEAVSFCLKESYRAEGAAELLPLGPPLLSFLSDALLSAEGEETGRDKPRLLGPYARGIALDVRGRPRTFLAAPSQLSPSPPPTPSPWPLWRGPLPVWVVLPPLPLLHVLLSPLPLLPLPLLHVPLSFSAWQGTISLVSFVVAANNALTITLNYC